MVVYAPMGKDVTMMGECAPIVGCTNGGVCTNG